jgi:hypothetical protein
MSLRKPSRATCFATDLSFDREPYLIVVSPAAPNSDFTMGSAFTRIAPSLTPKKPDRL